MHRLRSTLTALGIIFGVSSVIAMLAIGEGASRDAQEKIAQLGSRNIIIKTVDPPEDKMNRKLVLHGLRIMSNYKQRNEYFLKIMNIITNYENPYLSLDLFNRVYLILLMH